MKAPDCDDWRNAGSRATTVLAAWTRLAGRISGSPYPRRGPAEDLDPRRQADPCSAAPDPCDRQASSFAAAPFVLVGADSFREEQAASSHPSTRTRLCWRPSLIRLSKKGASHESAKERRRKTGGRRTGECRSQRSAGSRRGDFRPSTRAMVRSQRPCGPDEYPIGPGPAPLVRYRVFRENVS